MKIVAFVGADGTGKSTQARMLAERLVSEGRRARCVRPVFLLFDPWRLRAQGPADATLSPRMRRVAEASGERRPRKLALRLRTVAGYLYAVATYVYMRAAFWREDYLVCDRYLYQYFYDLFGESAVSVATAFPSPDVVFWLDGGLDLLQARSVKPMAAEESRYYASALAYYRELARRLPFVQLDAAADMETIRDDARRHLRVAARRASG